MPSDATVFVVDDDEQARDSVHALVQSMGLRTELFASAEDFLKSYDGRPGCVVTDFRLLGMSGLELQEALQARGELLPVIVITAYARTALTVRAMKQGAVTLLEKPYADDELWDAIREALECDQLRRERHLRRQELRRRIASLTPKELETMELMVAGKPNKVISRELQVSVRAVENRRQKVFRKMQVNSLPELARDVFEAKQSD